MERIRKLWHLYLWIIEMNNYKFIFIQYLATFLLAIIPSEYWDNYYFLISNLLGYSIFSNSLIAPKIWKETKKYTLFAKSMILSLIISNTFSIIALWTSYEYYTNIFDKYALISLTVLFYLYYIKNKRNNRRI